MESTSLEEARNLSIREVRDKKNGRCFPTKVYTFPSISKNGYLTAGQNPLERNASIFREDAFTEYWAKASKGRDEDVDGIKREYPSRKRCRPSLPMVLLCYLVKDLALVKAIKFTGGAHLCFQEGIFLLIKGHIPYEVIYTTYAYSGYILNI